MSTDSKPGNTGPHLAAVLALPAISKLASITAGRRLAAETGLAGGEGAFSATALTMSASSLARCSTSTTWSSWCASLRASLHLDSSEVSKAGVLYLLRCTIGQPEALQGTRHVEQLILLAAER